MISPSLETSAWSYVLDEPTRILIVDDDPILCEFARVHLATPAASVEAAPNGEVALDLLADGKFDVVLCDIAMPVLNGFELLTKMRWDPALRGLPVIMLTGKEDIASIDRAYKLGATSFATKPVNWRNLSYQIRYVLRNCRTASELSKMREHVGQKAPPDLGAPASFRRECADGLAAVLQALDRLRAGEGPVAPHLAREIERIERLVQALRERCEPVSFTHPNVSARAETDTRLAS